MGGGRTAEAGNSGATGFLSASHLVQMDARVHGSFGLVALEVGLHSLLTHAHCGKHLSDLLHYEETERNKIIITIIKTIIIIVTSGQTEHLPYRQKFMVLWQLSSQPLKAIVVL